MKAWSRSKKIIITALLVVTSPIWLLLVYSTVLYLAAAFVDNVLYTSPFSKALNLEGRKMLIFDTQSHVHPYRISNRESDEDMTRDRLSLVTFGAHNERSVVQIPHTPLSAFLLPHGLQDSVNTVLYPTTAILDNGAVVWSDVSDPRYYKIWKYENATTTLVTAFPQFHLAEFAKAYQAHQIDITPEILSSTGYIWAASFIPMSSTSIGFLDAMVTKGDGTKLTEAQIRLRTVDVESGEEGEQKSLLTGRGLNPDYTQLAANSQWRFFNFDLPDSEKKTYGFVGIMKADEGYDWKTARESIVPLFKFMNQYPEGLAFITKNEIQFFGVVYVDQNDSSHPARLFCALTQENSCHIELGNNEGALPLNAENSRTIFSSLTQYLGSCMPDFAGGADHCDGYNTNRILTSSKEGTSTLLALDYVGSNRYIAPPKIELLSEDKKLIVVSDQYIKEGVYIVADPLSEKKGVVHLPDIDSVLYLK